jgi:hypothetical protein
VPHVSRMTKWVVGAGVTCRHSTVVDVSVAEDEPGLLASVVEVDGWLADAARGFPTARKTRSPVLIAATFSTHRDPALL